MNGERAPDLDPLVEMDLPPLASELPSDDELDALCDQMMRIDIEQPSDAPREHA